MALTKATYSMIQGAVANVLDYGADLTGVASSSAAIQAAIDSGNSVYVPNGTYLITTPLVVTDSFRGNVFFGESQAKTIIKTLTGNLFNIKGNSIRFENLYLQSGAAGGHVFSQTEGISNIDVGFCRLSCLNIAKSVWENNGYETVALVIHDGILDITLSHTVAAVRLIGSNGDINSNTFENLTCNYSGNYAFYLESTNGGCSNNVFRNIVLETTNGGGISLKQCYQTVIDNVQGWDLGTLTQSLIYIASGGGLESKNTTIIGMLRLGGTLGASVYDVNIAAATRTTFISCGILQVKESALASQTAFIATKPTITDFSTTSVQVCSGIRFGSATGISQTAIPANNLRGRVTIENAATTAAVSFAQAETDTDYIILVSVMASGGTGAAIPATALRVSANDRSVNGFNVNLEAAPGVNNNVVVSWVIIR
jgi:hypothetical protein